MHGSIIEFLGNLTPDLRSKFKLWLFDDMCHLKPHAENPKQADQNDVTKLFAGLAKAVDKFHFPVHKKTDKYCQQNCNPNTELKKLGITSLNSPACEQAFKWINRFTNLKTMNEARFKFFLLYFIDLHNLHIGDSVDLIANPLNVKRPVSDASSSDKKGVNVNAALEEIATGLDKCKISENINHEEVFSDCFQESSMGDLTCKFCPAAYKKEGNLRNHLESKHNKRFKIVCSVCDKEFAESSRLVRHKKTCK